MKSFIKSVLSSTKQTIDATDEMYKSAVSLETTEEALVSSAIFAVYCTLTGTKAERVIGLSNLGLLALCKASGKPMALPRLAMDTIQILALTKRAGVYNTTLVSLAAVGLASILTDETLGPKPEFNLDEFNTELDELKQTIQAEEAYTRTLSDEDVEELRRKFPEMVERAEKKGVSE